jgi:ABC-type enterochelin transport system substrate-binding protein
MSWTAEIMSKTWQDGVLIVDFKYSDGARTVTEKHKVSGLVPAEWAQKTAAARVSALDAVDKLTVNTGTVSPPTPDDSGLAEFRQDLRRLDIISKLVQMKVVDATDTRVVNFVNKLKGELVTYWSNI